MDEDYAERGGLRYGTSPWRSLNLTWPLAVLRLSECAVTLEARALFVKKKFRFERVDIERLTRFRSFFFSGVQIVHHVAGYPTFIVFWTLDYAGLRRRFARLGYPVSEE